MASAPLFTPENSDAAADVLRPKKDELETFGAPDFVIYNAGAFPANRLTAGMGSKTTVDLSLEDKELVILGTEYAGEMNIVDAIHRGTLASAKTRRDPVFRFEVVTECPGVPAPKSSGRATPGSTPPRTRRARKS